VLKQRFPILLAALALLLFVAPMVRAFGSQSHTALGNGVVAVALLAVLVAALFAVRAGRRLHPIDFAITIPTLILQFVSAAIDSNLVLAIHHVFTALFLGYIVVAILRMVFSTRRVTFDTISASLCVYVLLGILWAVAYSLLELASPGSFSFSFIEAQEAAPLMCLSAETAVYPLYFSFVTLTTLGYGDIVPHSSPVRMAATFEALTGQLYLVVLVARLVALHISESD